MNKSKLIAILAALVLGVVASLLPVNKIRDWIKAQYWGLQLDVATDDQVELVIGKIVELDQAGIPILVKALGSDRERVSSIAKEELLRLLDNWQNLSARQHTARLEVLAVALAGRLDHFGPAARSDAVDLATRILLRPLKGRGGNSDKLLTDTEKVLRSGAGSGSESQAAASFPPAGPNTANPLASLQLTPFQSEEASGESLAHDESSASSPAAADIEDADNPENQPGLLDQAEVARAAHSLNQLREPQGIADSNQSMPISNQSLENERQSTASDRVRSTTHLAADASNSQASFSLAEADALQLIKQLQDDSEIKTADAEAELIRRGFSRAQLKLACRLFDPNPAKRKELVQQLPDMQNVNALPWLLWLCHDPDAEVRLAAITMLATSLDPTVLDQLQQIVQSDPDAAVRRLAERITLQRNSLR
jgi:hypothetical protein